MDADQNRTTSTAAPSLPAPGSSGEKPPGSSDILRKQTERPASATYASTVYVLHVCAFRKRPLSYRRPRPPGTDAGWKDGRRLPERTRIQFKSQDLQIILKGRRLFDLIPRGEFQPEEHLEASFRAANSVVCSLLDAADVFPATNVSCGLDFILFVIQYGCWEQQHWIKAVFNAVYQPVVVLSCQ